MRLNDALNQQLERQREKIEQLIHDNKRLASCVCTPIQMANSRRLMLNFQCCVISLAMHSLTGWIRNF